MIKRYLFILLFMISFSVCAVVDGSSSYKPVEGNSIISKQKTPEEQFYFDNPDKYQSILVSPQFKRSLTDNLYYFDKDQHRSLSNMGYYPLGGVDFNVMWNSLSDNEKVLEKQALNIDTLNNVSEKCTELFCNLKNFFINGFHAGENAMAKTWLQGNTEEEKKNFFEQGYIRANAYLRSKMQIEYIDSLRKRVAFSIYSCDSNTDCSFDYTKKLDIISKLLLLCSGNKDLKNENNYENFQQCITALSNTVNVQKVIIKEGFIEGYTALLNLDFKRSF